MAEIKLVAESLQEHITPTKKIEEGFLDSAKTTLEKFLKKDTTQRTDKELDNVITTVFGRQFSKMGGDKLKAAVLKLSPDFKMKILTKAAEVFKNPEIAYTYLLVKNGKIVNVGGLKGEAKTGLVNSVGNQ